ncbi:hypothetical protein cyc_04277 [Cyclospora cayetanensis]|uniref:HEAT repeat-containing protein n=1 Tax=Cyclospora cayetanensis TaxID=88456 RepID=A0A1D3D0S1_9EIME|nr:hypothetical protein cyc_04277 [Cyclospora cayetanensis]
MPQMSVPANQTNNSMKEILLQLQSADTAVRGAAEELLNKSPLDHLLPALATAAAASTSELDVSSGQLAAVLLRRYAHSKLKSFAANPQQKQQLIEAVMQNIVGALSSGSPLILRKAAAEAIGELWRHLPSTTSISQTVPFGLVMQWLESQEQQERQKEDECVLWLLLDRLGEATEAEVYVRYTPQIVRKLNITFQKQEVEGLRNSAACLVEACLQSATAAEEALATLFVRTVRWKADSVQAKEAKKAATAAYSSLCPTVLQLVTRLPRPELLAPLLSLAERGSQFFKDHHSLLLESVRAILSKSATVGEDALQMILQLAAAAFLGAPKFSRKHLPLVNDLLLILADAAVAAPAGLEDAAGWEAQAREEETPEETLHSVALELMAEAAAALCDNPGHDQGAPRNPQLEAASPGSPDVMEMLMKIVSRLLEQEEPRYGFSALELLGLLLDDDTCRPLLGNFMEPLITSCMAAVKSSFAHLRWGGLKCLGLMLQHDEQWSRKVQQQHGEQLLSLLSQESAADPSVRCRRQALLALAAFLSGLAPEEGEEPSPQTLAFVRRSPCTEKYFYQCHFMAIAVIAGCSSEDLQTQEFALSLASALAKAKRVASVGSPGRSGHRCMRPLVAAALLFGSGVFLRGSLVSACQAVCSLVQDAPWLVDRIHRLMLSCEAVPAASAVFCSAMSCLAVAAPACGPELLHQMQPLMAIVLQKAKTDIKGEERVGLFAVQILEFDVHSSGLQLGVTEELGSAGGSLNAGAELSEEGGVSQFRVQDKTGKQTIISINTAAVEERVAALRLLGALALAGGAQTPLVLAIEWTAAVLESCSSEFTIVRSEAFDALPGCLAALESSPEQQGQTATAVLELVAAFLSSGEGQLLPSQATLAAEHMLPAVAQIVGAQGKKQREGMLPQACQVPQQQRALLLEKLFAGMGKLMLPVLTREFERLANKEQQDDDWEDLSDDEGEEDSSTYYDSVMQCSGSFFKVYGSECLPHFHEHLRLPYGALLAHEQSSYYGKVAALCIYADAINYGDPSGTVEYSTVFLPGALLAVGSQPEYISDEDHLLAISASAYGMGALAQRHPELFLPSLQRAVESLERCLSSPLLRTESGRAVADCAACALLKIFVQFGPKQDLEKASEMLAKLLEAWFPLMEDEQEIFDGHELLLQMVVQSHPLCSSVSVQQQLRRLIVEVIPGKPELLGERARRELLQAAKDKLC